MNLLICGGAGFIGSAFIKNHLIRPTERAFDDFASVSKDDQLNRQILGL